MLNKTLHPGADIGGNNDLRLDRIVCRNLCLQGMLKRLFARFAEKLLILFFEAEIWGG